MKIIDADTITSLHISPATCVEWVKEAFNMKHLADLPQKISLHPRGNDFVNTMPCLLPPQYHTYGCKIVSRIKGTHPALKSEVILFDTLKGDMTAMMNADWITAMRTGAVAALAIKTFQKSDARIYSFVGLGVIGHAVLRCLIATNEGKEFTVRLKRYKDHAEKMVAEFKDTPGVTFEISDTMEELVTDADVVISSITDADGLLVEDVSLFKPGVLVLPVHTRGFQNCDTVFDKVFADDKGHVENFRYFSQFRKFGEIADVLNGTIPGRENDNERILSYNIGIALHDVLFAYKILNLNSL